MNLEIQKMNEETKEKKQIERFGAFAPEKISIDFAWTHFTNNMEIKLLAEETKKGYQRFYKKFLAVMTPLFPNIKDLPSYYLNDDAIKACFISTLGKTVNEQTLNYYLRTYRAFGKFCEEEGYLSGFKLKIREREPEIKELYSMEEIKKLMKKPSVKNYVEMRDYTIIALILGTGARSNTIRNIKMKDFNPSTGEIVFNTTKARRVVKLSLPKGLVAILTSFVAHWRMDADKNDYLFPSYSNKNKQLSRKGLSDSIAEYNKSRGVSKTSCHLLRHTFANNHIADGGDISTLAEILTHSTLEMSKRYANLNKENLRKEMEEHSLFSKVFDKGTSIAKKTTSA